METTIRKVLVPRFGDESVLQAIEAKIASPQAGEVQVLHSVVAGSESTCGAARIRFRRSHL